MVLCTGGIGVEFGFQYDLDPAAGWRSILTAFPRLEMKRRFADSVCRIVKAKPETTYDNFRGGLRGAFRAGLQSAVYRGFPDERPVPGVGVSTLGEVADHEE